MSMVTVAVALAEPGEGRRVHLLPVRAHDAREPLEALAAMAAAMHQNVCPHCLSPVRRFVRPRAPSAGARRARKARCSASHRTTGVTIGSSSEPNW